MAGEMKGKGKIASERAGASLAPLRAEEFAQPREPQGYKVGEWSGRPHYQCEFCSFDSFQQVQMLEHLVSFHELESALVELVALEGTEEVENGTNSIG